jgi:hypothetical protein
MAFSPLEQGMCPGAELRHQVLQHRGTRLGGSRFTELLSKVFTELNPKERCPQNEGCRGQLFGPVITMKLDYPYKTATVEEDAMVVPRPYLPD